MLDSGSRRDRKRFSYCTTKLYIKFLVSVRASVSTRAEKVWHGMSVKVSVRDQTGYGYG